jgi:hypothetical protein
MLASQPTSAPSSSQTMKLITVYPPYHCPYAFWRDDIAKCKLRATAGGGTFIADENADHGRPSKQTERREPLGLFLPHAPPSKLRYPISSKHAQR